MRRTLSQLDRSWMIFTAGLSFIPGKYADLRVCSHLWTSKWIYFSCTKGGGSQHILTGINWGQILPTHTFIGGQQVFEILFCQLAIQAHSIFTARSVFDQTTCIINTWHIFDTLKPLGINEQQLQCLLTGLCLLCRCNCFNNSRAALQKGFRHQFPLSSLAIKA